MCADNKNQFSCNWKIKNIFNYPLFNVDSDDESDDESNDDDNLGEQYSTSLDIEFEAQSCEKSEWVIYLRKKNVAGDRKLMSQLHLKDFDGISGKLNLHYKYELLDPDGNIFAASEVLNNAFEKGSDSEPYEMISEVDFMREISGWNEDTLIIRCCMAETLKELSLLVGNHQMIDCEVEMICNLEMRQFMWYTHFNQKSTWSQSKHVYGLNIPLEITFGKVNGKIKTKIESNIEDDWEHIILCKISVTNSNGTENSEEDVKTLSKNDRIWNFPDFISMEFLNSSVNETIKIEFYFESLPCIKASYHASSKKPEMQRNVPVVADKYLYLRQNLRDLFTNKYFSNVKLQAGGEIFVGHKGLLAARSPVFLAMFQHDMKESNNGIVDVLEADAKSLKSFLEFIYTGEVVEMDEEVALSMLIMADKYQVPSLENKCSTFLKSVLSSRKACEVLSVADMVNSSSLKSYVVDFIIGHSKEVLSSKEWSVWAKNNIHLATEVILKLSNKFESHT